MYYDYNKVLSYNAMLNFIIGERGVGKTYGAKEFVLNRFKNKRKQFAYIRRYETELDEAVGNNNDQMFFKAIKDKFPNDKFDISKPNKVHKFKMNDKICGYGIPLSISSILKSAEYKDVDTIIFDEFIIDKGNYHYLKNEVEVLLDLIESIARMRNIRVLFLGNAITITNPYFTYFNLRLPYNTDIITFKKGLILVNYIENIEYRTNKRLTKFGQLIEGTNYERYAIDNEFLRDSKAFIQKKTPGSKFYFKVRYENKLYGIWIDYKLQLMFVSLAYDPNCPIEFSFNIIDHNETTILIRSKRSVHIQNMTNFYKVGKLKFESQQIKNIFMEFLARYLKY